MPTSDSQPSPHSENDHETETLDTPGASRTSNSVGSADEQAASKLDGLRDLELISRFRESAVFASAEVLAEHGIAAVHFEDNHFRHQKHQGRSNVFSGRWGRRECAIKQPRMYNSSNPIERMRFIKGACLQHYTPSAPEIIGGVDVDQGFLGMRYVLRTLQDLMDDQALTSLEQRFALGQLAIDAVREAHDNGIVHRDVKPSNLLVESNERTVFLCDFDISGVQGEQLGDGPFVPISGTPHYMSPEQARGDEDNVTFASDVRSLGIVLHQLLDGEHKTPIEMRNPKLPSRPEEIALLQTQIESHDPEIETVVRQMPWLGIRKQLFKRRLRRLLKDTIAFDRVDRFPTVDILSDEWHELRRRL